MGKISFESFSGNPLSKVLGKAVNDIDLSGRYMERMGDFDKQAALRNEHTLIHVGNKFLFRFRKVSGNFIGKR